MNEKGYMAMDAEPKGLEASLQHLIDLHHHKSLVLAHHTDKAKKDAIRKAERVSDLLVEAVNGGVQDSFINQKRIELEIRTLAATITRFMKQTDQWLAATHALNTALKEIGDFENWMKIMEFDCKSITTAIQNIHQDSKSDITASFHACHNKKTSYPIAQRLFAMRRYGGGILYAALPLHMQRGCFRIRTHDQQVTKAQLYPCMSQ
ncbi:hypothetical protein AAZX31_14G187500 [Glycine max]|nr:hypothetical protein GYH30_040639 [Glycine max]|eukprot:XP_003544921.1 biogenesis of lysosome-related organelles complex 1 subunit 1-like [Glycine max]